MNNVKEHERHLLVKTVKQMVGQVMAKTGNKFCFLKVLTVTFIVIVFSITQRFNGYDLHVSHLVTTFFCKYQEISKQLKTLPDSVTSSCDVIFTIKKTTEKLHQSRLELVLKTWSKLVEKQVSKVKRATFIVKICLKVQQVNTTENTKTCADTRFSIVKIVSSQFHLILPHISKNSATVACCDVY